MRGTLGLDVDDAFMALLIAAMDASGHVGLKERVADPVLEVIRIKNSA